MPHIPPRYQRLVEWLARYPDLTVAQLSETLGVLPSVVRSYLTVAKRHGLVVSVPRYGATTYHTTEHAIITTPAIALDTLSDAELTALKHAIEATQRARERESTIPAAMFSSSW